MTIDLSQKVLAIGQNGKEIKLEDGASPDLKHMSLLVLRSHIPGDEKVTLEDKDKRYLLIKKIEGAKEPIDLTQSAIDLLVDRGHRVFMDIELSQKYIRLIQGKDEHAPL